MGFESDISNYIVENTEDKKTPPDDFNVKLCGSSIWDTNDDKDVVIVGKWDIEKDIVGQDRRVVYPNKESPLYKDIYSGLNDVRSRVTKNRQDVNVSELSISPTYKNDNPDSEFAPEWAGEITSNYKATFNIGFESGIEDKEYALVREILDTFENITGDSLLTSDYERIVLYFSDLVRCKSSTIKSDVLTDRPHLYYNHVESVEAYCEFMSEDNEQYENMVQQDTYSVSARLGYEDGYIDSGYIPENVSCRSESLMSSRIDQLVDIDGQKIFEAESIVIESGESIIRFCVRVPIDGFR